MNKIIRQRYCSITIMAWMRDGSATWPLKNLPNKIRWIFEKKILKNWSCVLKPIYRLKIPHLECKKVTFCFWSCEELEICAKMKIINFVTRSTSSSWLFDLPDQSGAARVYSYNFLCSISLETAINDIFSWARITQALSIFIKRLEKQTVHWGFTQIVWY